MPILIWVFGCVLVVYCNGFTGRSCSEQRPEGLNCLDWCWRKLWHTVGIYGWPSEQVLERSDDSGSCIHMVAKETLGKVPGGLEDLRGGLAKAHSVAIDLSVSFLPFILMLLAYDLLTKEHLAARCRNCQRRLRKLKNGCCVWCGAEIFPNMGEPMQGDARATGVDRRIWGVALPFAFLCLWLSIVDSVTGVFVSPLWWDGVSSYSSVDLSVRGLWEYLGLYEGYRMPECRIPNLDPVRLLRPESLREIHQGVVGAIRLMPIVLVALLIYHRKVFPFFAPSRRMRCIHCHRSG